MAYRMKEKEKYIEEFNEEELDSSFEEMEDELDEDSLKEYSKYDSLDGSEEEEIESLEDQSYDDLLTPEEVYFCTDTDIDSSMITVIMTPIKYYNRTGHVSDWELTDLLPEDAIEGFMEESEGLFVCEDEDLSEKEIKSILKSRGFIFKKLL